jgi:hypothetical protein
MMPTPAAAPALAQARRSVHEAARLLYALAHADDPDRGPGEQGWLLDRHAQLVEALADLYPVELANHTLTRVQERLELVGPLSAAAAADLLMAWGDALVPEPAPPCTEPSR